MKSVQTAAVWLLALSPWLAQAQRPEPTPDSAVLRWARGAALALDSSGMSSTQTNVEALRRVISGARIVGIGESQHSMHELLIARYSIVRLLVVQFGFSGVAMETGLPEARRVDAWIMGESATEPAYASDLAYGFGRDAETIELLRWLREYNASLPPARRVHFYGVDLPHNGGGNVLPALEPVWDFLAKVDSAFVVEHRPPLEQVARRLASAGWWDVVARFDSLGPGGRDSLRDGIDALIDRLAAHRIEYARRTSPDDAAWAERLAQVARQSESLLRDGKLSPRNPRDTSMAANARWVMERERPRGAIVLLSHNTHIDAQPETGAFATDRLKELGYTGPPAPVTTMGSVLKARLGSDYVTIGTTFRVNAAQAVPHLSDSTSLDGMLARLGLPVFFLDLRNAPRSAATAWLDSPHLMRVSDAYITLVPRRSFDGIIYVDRIRPSVKVRQRAERS